MKQKITTFVLCVLLGILAVISLRIAADLIDLEFTHFEDGSGRITYCLPFDDAGPYLGGCN